MISAEQGSTPEQQGIESESANSILASALRQHLTTRIFAQDAPAI
jgi:hypothetical protein